jgi:hypothetical protein
MNCLRISRIYPFFRDSSYSLDLECPLKAHVLKRLVLSLVRLGGRGKLEDLLRGLPVSRGALKGDSVGSFLFLTFTSGPEVNGYGATTHSHWMSCLATNPEQ